MKGKNFIIGIVAGILAGAGVCFIVMRGGAIRKQIIVDPTIEKRLLDINKRQAEILIKVEILEKVQELLVDKQNKVRTAIKSVDERINHNEKVFDYSSFGSHEIVKYFTDSL